jgi:hypothetical protein
MCLHLLQPIAILKTIAALLHSGRHREWVRQSCNGEIESGVVDPVREVHTFMEMRQIVVVVHGQARIARGQNDNFTRG